MQRQVLLDTGPLVAFLNQRDQFHSWAVTVWTQIVPPLLTCEAVITEAAFLLRNMYGWQEAVSALLESDTVSIAFHLNEEITMVRQLMTRYRNVPMSLADACLVRMAEQYSTSEVLTLDSDFRIYCKHRNEAIALVMPEGG